MSISLKNILFGTKLLPIIPTLIRAILACDAHLIYDLAYELLESMDRAGPDLKFMYFYVEPALASSRFRAASMSMKSPGLSIVIASGSRQVKLAKLPPSKLRHLKSASSPFN
jgi:hypothetical protein